MTDQLLDTNRTENHRLVPPPGTFAIDPVHTFVNFRAQHLVVGRVQGRFTGVTGTITVDDDFLKSHVEVAIEASSINTLFPVRDDDLRSANYLDVDHYPDLVFASTNLTELPSGQWVLGGDLTIRDTTLPLELAFTFGGALADPFGNLRVGFHATATISRKDYRLFTMLESHSGNVHVARDVDIEIDVEATQPL
ncbi:MAG TPA: YceI family protein [Acidimicrobiales bacterium]|jgi:polyisoprenoid-binding protein YceI